MKWKLLIGLILIILVVPIVAADDMSVAKDSALRINETLSGKLPFSASLTNAQIVSAGYTPLRDGDYSILIKNASYDEGNGTFVTYINAWNNGTSLHIHNPVHWFIPVDFSDLNGAALQQAYVVMIVSYLDNVPYGEPEQDDTAVIYASAYGYSGNTTALSYANIRAGNGDTSVSNSGTSINAPIIDTSSTAGTYHILRRGVLSFNSGILPDDATISSANVSVYVTAKTNALGSPGFGITGGRLLSNTSVANGDYQNFTGTRYASDIAYASLGTSARNNWSMNAAGLANISKTQYTVIYLRDSWDIDSSTTGLGTTKNSNTGFTWSNASGQLPYLEVIYAAAPVAAFSANVTSGCAPLSVAFTDSSQYTPTNWDWYFWANETKSSDDQNPTYAFPTAGTSYNIRLYVSNAQGGDWENKTAYISTTAAPVGAFTKNTSTGTAPQIVTFTDTSTGTPTSWKWVFGDGSTENDTQQNPYHTFTSAGTYNVNLTATNCGGSNTTATQQIVISAAGEPFDPTTYGNWTEFWVNSTQTLTNYPVKMILDNRTGTSTTTLFYTNGTTKATWEDVAWTDTSNATLGYWKENRTDTATNTTWWVNVSSIANDNTTKIRLFYGNASKTVTYADGEKTFSLFDDFNGTGWDTAKWTAGSYDGSTFSNSILTKKNSNNVNYATTMSKSAFGANTAIESYMKIDSGGESGVIQWWGYGDAVFPTAPNSLYMYTASGTKTIGVWKSSDGEEVPSDYPHDTYFRASIIRNGTTSGIILSNGSNVLNSPLTTATHIPTANCNVSIAVDRNVDHLFYFDWIAVRKYNATEPFLSLPGGGAAAPVASFTITNSTVRIPKSVAVTDTSTNTPTSWEWSWGDGTANSTTQNPTHSYTTRGRFNIILTATNAGGSGTNSTNYVRVVGYENYY